MKISRPAMFFLPLGFSLCILAICYPGFMSYDSVRMLEEARSSVRGGIYPTTPVYVLRLFDITGHGPSLMILAQDFALLLAVTMLLRILRVSFWKSVISLATFLAMPTVIGCMLVLWKDVTSASLIALSASTILWASKNEDKHAYFLVAKWSSLVMVIVATLVRFNAISATVVLVIYWLNVFHKTSGWKARGATFAAITFSMVVSDKLLNEYTFPNFRALEPNPLPYVVMANDLIGVSGWSRVPLVPIDSSSAGPTRKVPISAIDRIYSSLGALAMNDNNIAAGYVVSVFPASYTNADVAKAWLNALLNHPTAYLRYRWDVFSEIIGAKNHGTFEPTHFNRIDENPFGIRFQDRYATDLILKFIRDASNVFLGKPWFALLIAAMTVLGIGRAHRIDPELRKFSYYSFATAILYIAPFYFVSATGEVRYCLPALALAANPVLVWIFGRIGVQDDAIESVREPGYPSLSVESPRLRLKGGLRIGG